MPDAPGADLLVVVGAGGRAALVQAVRRHRRGGGGLRPDALARPRQLRRRARHAARPRRRRGRGGLVRRAGAAGGGVARRGRGRARGLGPVRQGALHVRPRDRLLPGGQARPRGDPAAQRELALAHVLHGLGGPGQARGVPGRGVRRSGSPRATRSTTRRAPRSPSTAASARPGSTTRRCTSGAPSSRGGCWPGPRTPPTAWPASCSPPRARRRRPSRTSRRGRSAAAAPCAVCSGRWSRRPC